MVEMTETTFFLEVQSQPDCFVHSQCRMLFESVRWSYPVHAFIGKIIRGMAS